MLDCLPTGRRRRRFQHRTKEGGRRFFPPDAVAHELPHPPPPSAGVIYSSSVALVMNVNSMRKECLFVSFFSSCLEVINRLKNLFDLGGLRKISEYINRILISTGCFIQSGTGDRC